MPSLRTRIVSALVVLLPAACRGGELPAIGDAYPRDSLSAPFVGMIRSMLEADGLRMRRWTVTGIGATIQLNTEQATAFAQDRSVIGVVGHAGSRDALLGAAVYNARGVPQVVPNATSRRLSSAGPWTFGLVPSDSVEGEFLAQFAIDSLRAERIAVLYIGDEYGIGLRDGIRTGLRRRGRSEADASMVPIMECVSPGNAAVFASLVGATVQRANPDVVILAVGSENGWCLADELHARSPNTWILCADGLEVRRMPGTGTRLVRGRIRGVEFWKAGTDSLNREFVARVRAATGRDPTPSEALQVDAYRVLAAAIREAGADRAAVRDWLASLGRDRPPLPGVTGPIAFNHPRTLILRMSEPFEEAS